MRLVDALRRESTQREKLRIASNELRSLRNERALDRPFSLADEERVLHIHDDLEGITEQSSSDVIDENRRKKCVDIEELDRSFHDVALFGRRQRRRAPLGRAQVLLRPPGRDDE